MSTESYNVTLSCSCGSTQFSYDGEPTAETVMTCTQCGASGTYGNILEQAQAQITQQYKDAFKDIFKK